MRRSNQACNGGTEKDAVEVVVQLRFLMFVPWSSCCISISISINSTWWFVVVFVEFLVVIFVLILVLFNFLFCCVLVFVLYFLCKLSVWKFFSSKSYNLKLCFFLPCVVVAVLGTVEITSHYALLVHWGSDSPSLKFSLLFVVVFLHGWHHGALLVCPWPSSRTLLPQQRNDSQKEKLFVRKPIKEVLKNILFNAKLLRDEEKHLGLFDRSWFF